MRRCFLCLPVCIFVYDTFRPIHYRSLHPWLTTTPNMKWIPTSFPNGNDYRPGNFNVIRKAWILNFITLAWRLINTPSSSSPIHQPALFSKTIPQTFVPAVFLCLRIPFSTRTQESLPLFSSIISFEENNCEKKIKSIRKLFFCSVPGNLTLFFLVKEINGN